MKYISAFAPYIEGLIEQKRIDGFSYVSAEYQLKQFDAFCVARFPNATSLNCEIVVEWSAIKSNEGRNARDNRVATIRQLGLYMLSLGLIAYIPCKYAKKQKPVLYVPTREEMTAFFKGMDRRESPFPHTQRFIFECKMIFLLLYCCGMRVSEARLLKKENIDWKKGILTVLESKGHKDRLVYLPQDGVGVFAEYLRDIKTVIPDSPWMFPGMKPEQPISYGTVKLNFKVCWSKLPFAENSNKRPTPHCLRHAFVVERLNEWMKQGMDTQKMLVYLSKHLGHTSTEETHYYYHLVQKAFAIIKKNDTVSNRVIPEVIPYEDY